MNFGFLKITTLSVFHQRFELLASEVLRNNLLILVGLPSRGLLHNDSCKTEGKQHRYV